jgi:small subunit ribosomal protein S7
MPRKILKPKKKKNIIRPDFKFNSLLVARFINKLNFNGLKSVAESILYKSFNVIKRNTNDDPLIIFNKALENIRPLIQVKPRRVGGATYQVPMEIPTIKSFSIAINWIIKVSRDKKTNKPMYIKLAQEIIDGSKKEGTAIKKRDDMHKMAEANKAFAHYRW